MRILKFEGATMRDAIAKVKAQLGDQAVIVSTRQIKRGMLGGTGIEISAAIDDEDQPPAGTPAFAAGPMRREPEQDRDVDKLIAPLRNEMRSLRAMVRASDSSRSTQDIRSEVAELRKLVEQLQKPPPPPPPARAAVPIRSQAPAPAPTVTMPSSERVLLFVGPTGAGKTTTIAKLAARAALIQNKRVRLITLDNYRVGGVDQIRTFAELIGVPLTVAESAADLVTILTDDDADHYDLTLIDTAGKSPRDTGAIIELAAELPSLPPIETHVVMPAATSRAAAEAMVDRFRPLAPARLLVTKVDEVDVPSELFSLPARLDLPITWITTGQAVPEDLEEPTSARIVELTTHGLHYSHRVA